MKLIIAEKPMLARDIARAMCDVPVSETAQLPINGNGWTVCACAGHIMRLEEPQEINSRFEKWDEDFLPIYQTNWKKVPVKDKISLVNQIDNLLKQADLVVNAGDPDDEGQMIVDEVLDYLEYKGKVMRVYVNDNIEANIRKAFDHLEDNSKCKQVGRGAYARQMADMVFGINETRLATKRLGKLLSVGRVQTPTLRLVVNRDKQIESHSKRKYYELMLASRILAKSEKKETKFDVLLKFKPLKSFLSEENHVFDLDIIEKAKIALNGSQVVLTAKRSKKTENPPLPYNLTVLQSEMNKRFGYSAKKTLDITQSLRDKYKAITYNRSDSQYLKEEHYEQARDVLGLACENIGLSWKLDFNLKSKAFNDKNVTAHHGIIPQAIKFNIASMTKDEKNVYESIVKRYALQFLPPVQYEICKLQFEFEMGVVEQELKKLVNSGYKGVLHETDINCIDNLPDDGEYCITGKKYIVNEKETTPPKPYTEGTLIADMSCIAKYVKDGEIRRILKEKDDGKKGENGGIGTTATRASIIETLKKRGYLQEEKGKLKSTEFAKKFYEIIPENIKTADVTAKWWLIQQDIAEGKQDVNAIMNSVIEEFNKHKETAYRDSDVSTKKVVGRCPKCGKNVVFNGNSYQCESNKWIKDDSGAWSCKDGCQFSLKGFAGKKFSEKQVKDLLSKKTIKMTGCKSRKTEKTYSCSLSLNEEGGLDVKF